MTGELLFFSCDDYTVVHWLKIKSIRHIVEYEYYPYQYSPTPPYALSYPITSAPHFLNLMPGGAAAASIRQDARLANLY